MPNNWKTYKLSEVGEIIGGGTPSTTKQEYYNGNISWITPRDLSNHNSMFISKGERSITELGLKNSSAKLMPKGSVLLTSRAPIGYLAISENEVCTNQGFKSIAVNDKIADNKFIYYLLKTNIDLLLQNATGSTFQEVSGNIIKNLEFKFPPLQEQQSIASILSAIDDKIENNLAINKTLEEMAMALYKHWFVDFGPFKEGEFEESELGLIPKGWEVKSIEDLLIIKPINGLYKKSEYQGFGKRWLKMSSVYGLDIITNQKMDLISVTEKEIQNFGCIKDDIVFGRTSLVLEGIGKCAIIKSEVDVPIFESNLFRIRLNKEIVYPDIIYLFFKSQYGRDEVKKLARQTAAVSITSKDLTSIKIAIPNIQIQKEIAGKLDSYIKKQIENFEENQTLTQLRDTLLPKLISGEVQLKEFRETITN